jgi:Mn2+/Fe2+ NRAMP family transporter
LPPHLQFNGKYLLIWSPSGTTISPYLFFWQASQEVEEERRWAQDSGACGRDYAELKHAAWDTEIGMFFCNLIFLLRVVAAAATLHLTGKTDIQSAADAAQAR